MKSGFTRRLKLPLILTLAHSVMKQLGVVEYINENVSWDPAHWEMSPGDLAQLLILSTFTDIRIPLTHLEDRLKGSMSVFSCAAHQNPQPSTPLMQDAHWNASGSRIPKKCTRSWRFLP